MPDPVDLPFPDDVRGERARRAWWRARRERQEGAAVINGWLAAALRAAPTLTRHRWRWFAGRPLPDGPSRPLTIDALLDLGGWWQTLNTERRQGQWFTPPPLVARLLDGWANNWLRAQGAELSWDGQDLSGSHPPDAAGALLDHWLRFQVLDPAMGAADWLLGWYRLHQALGAALAARCGRAAPAPAQSLATLHGVDVDPQAVALGEVRLGLLAGQPPDLNQLVVANSLLPADDHGGEWLWPELAGFDLILGNPPFVSTKGLDAVSDRRALQARYGYADDLYVHFVERAFERLVPGGWLLFILSDTFRTTVTKERLRRLLLSEGLHRLEALPAASFTAVVGTVAVTARRGVTAETVSAPPHGDVPLAEMVFGPRQVLIEPSERNRSRLAALSPHWARLIDAWWPDLRDSRRQLAAESRIKAHRQALKPGDWTLLGLLCEGGVGLQTGDNGAFLGVRGDSADAEAVQRRQAALLACWQQDEELAARMPAGPFEAVATALREHFPAPRLGFKRGEVWRLVPADQIAEPMDWPETWRESGAPGGPSWVPYEKGDPEGRRWTHENPYLINWDQATVARLRGSRRGPGEPVLRNPRFFFRAGVTWSNMSSQSLKARLQPPCVFDVGSMTLFPLADWLDAYVLLAWLNATPVNQLLKAFVNHTLNFQINDLRLVPVRVPANEEVRALGALARAAVNTSCPFAGAQIEAEINFLIARQYGSAWVDGAPGVGRDRPDLPPVSLTTPL